MKKARKVPAAFTSEAEERAHWESENSTAGLDWRRAGRVRLPNLQPSTTAISLRLPISLLEEIKIAAHMRDVPYQSLVKMWLSEKVGRAP
jgi:predicted DNA binding CopG/RHH family protein